MKLRSLATALALFPLLVAPAVASADTTPAPSPPFSNAPTPAAAYPHLVALYRAGTAAFRRGDAPAAIRDLTDAASTSGINKDDAYRVFKVLGAAYTANKDYPDAYSSFTIALRMHPDSSVVWQLRGYVSSQMGHLDAGYADLRQAGKVDSKLAGEWSTSALALYRKGEYVHAMGQAKLALVIDPADPLGSVLVCDIFTRVNRAKDAIDACTATLALPTLSNLYREDALGDRAYARAVTNDLRRGLDDANAAIAIAPHPLGLDFYRRGLIEDYESKPNDAAMDLERAIALDPRLAEAHLKLGETYQDLGRRSEAKTQYAAAVALDASMGAKTQQLIADMDRPRNPVVYSPSYSEPVPMYTYVPIDTSASDFAMQQAQEQALETMNEMNEAHENAPEPFEAPAYEAPSE